MSDSKAMTSGNTPKRRRSVKKDVYELLGSMRFAVSLLTFICICTVIGTVLQQNQNDIEYINMFGTFWYALFSQFDVAGIYNTWWFLVTMAFLVVSTTVCLTRNTPKMIRDMRSFKDYVRQTSLRAFPHKIDITSPLSAEDGVALGRSWLRHHGYQFREKNDGTTHLLAAKKGSSNRLGFIAAHLAIVVICVGGLIDSELPNRLQIWTGYKSPIPDEVIFVAEVDKASRYGPNNPSFRGNVVVSEGQSSDYALLSIDNGVYMQELPFSVQLNRFIIEYYEANGQPKRFASEVTIHDYATGETWDEVIEVNHPHTVRGVTLYQSSFEDGGSKLWLRALPLQAGAREGFDFWGEVGSVNPLHIRFAAAEDGEIYQVRFDEFTPINVEDLSEPGQTKRTLQEQVVAVTGSAASKNDENVRNVGPSFVYTLTDSTNQSLQFKNYMLPVPINQTMVFLLGLKEPTAAQFQYLFIPADDYGTMDEFLAMLQLLNSPEGRARAVRDYVNMMPSQQLQSEAVSAMAHQALTLFAQGGFMGVERYLQGGGVPEQERVPESLRDPLQRMMHDYVVFSVMQFRQYAREGLGYPALDYDDPAQVEAHALWLETALRALSDMPYYPVPMVLHLGSFEHIQASVLQATRSPGKWIVYTGTFFLMIGVFMMLYVRDRRIWFWVTPAEEGGSVIRAAMTSHKRTLDFRNEFNKFQQDFAQAAHPQG